MSPGHVQQILAGIIAKRLRWRSEKMKLLDNNQSGIRLNRSTADATQIIFRIEEDTSDLIKRRGTTEDTDPTGRLLDLKKAYFRVSKPALWEILKRYGLIGNFLETFVDLHDSTTYCIQGKYSESKQWMPQRGLREG